MNFSVVTVILMIYFIIGAIVATWLWNKSYKKSYDEAKASGEGVEKGMVNILLTTLMIFWPFVLIYKLLKK